MMVRQLKWQCEIGNHFRAPLWADCEPATIEALEKAWKENVQADFTIQGWPDYTYHLVFHNGLKFMVQENNQSGKVRQLQRIILMSD